MALALVLVLGLTLEVALALGKGPGGVVLALGLVALTCNIMVSAISCQSTIKMRANVPRESQGDTTIIRILD